MQTSTIILSVKGWLSRRTTYGSAQLEDYIMMSVSADTDLPVLYGTLRRMYDADSAHQTMTDHHKNLTYYLNIKDLLARMIFWATLHQPSQVDTLLAEEPSLTIKEYCVRALRQFDAFLGTESASAVKAKLNEQQVNVKSSIPIIGLGGKFSTYKPALTIHNKLTLKTLIKRLKALNADVPQVVLLNTQWSFGSSVRSTTVTIPIDIDPAGMSAEERDAFNVQCYGKTIYRAGLQLQYDKVTPKLKCTLDSIKTDYNTRTSESARQQIRAVLHTYGVVPAFIPVRKAFDFGHAEWALSTPNAEQELNAYLKEHTKVKEEPANA